MSNLPPDSAGSDDFIDLDDELDDGDGTEAPVEPDQKEPRKKVWRRTGNGAWEGERGLDQNDGENFTGAGLYLSKRRSGKRLRGFEEADLIRAYRAGDKLAGDRLAQSLLWLVRGIAGNQKKGGKPLYGRAFYGPSFDERVAAGLAGLQEAINKYDFSRNTRLSTYARWRIMKSIGEECQRWRYRGMGGQTRADKYLFSHSDATAEEVAAKAHCSLESARAAIARLQTTELPYETIAHTNARSDKAARLYDCFGPRQLSSYIFHHKPPRPKFSEPPLRDFLSAGKWPGYSRIVDGLAEDAAKRAAGRLKAIGRRAYALELVEKQQRQLAAIKERDRAEWALPRIIKTTQGRRVWPRDISPPKRYVAKDQRPHKDPPALTNLSSGRGTKKVVDNWWGGRWFRDHNNAIANIRNLFRDQGSLNFEAKETAAITRIINRQRKPRIRAWRAAA